MGTSGGAYTSLQIADEFPGLFDGILINATFPDALSIALAGLDAHLLTHYFAATDANAFTRGAEGRRHRLSGDEGVPRRREPGQRTDPVAGSHGHRGLQAGRVERRDADGAALRRRAPTRRARGRRCSTRRATSTASIRRPASRCGRSTTSACSTASRRSNAGTITPAQFLDLNERDRRLRSGRQLRRARARSATSARSSAPTRAASRSAAAAGSPRFRSSTMARTTTSGGYHYQWFHFAIRERIAKQNGNADNHVMWRGPVQAEARVVRVHHSGSRTKTTRRPTSRTTRLLDQSAAWTAAGCDEKADAFVAEPQTFSSKPDSTCNTAYPVVGVHALRRRRTARRERAQVPAEADRREGLRVVHAGGTPASANDLSRRRLRLLEAGREPDARRAVGVVRSRAGEPGLRHRGCTRRPN